MKTTRISPIQHLLSMRQARRLRGVRGVWGDGETFIVLQDNLPPLAVVAEALYVSVCVCGGGGVRVGAKKKPKNFQFHFLSM